MGDRIVEDPSRPLMFDARHHLAGASLCLHHSEASVIGHLESSHHFFRGEA